MHNKLFRGLETWLYWLRVSTALAKNLSSIPHTHIRHLIVASNASSRRIRCLWPPKTPELACAYHTHARSFINKNKVDLVVIVPHSESRMDG